MRLWALESCPSAEPLFEAALELQGPPLLLVVGNELSGVDPGILEICEKVVAIPMSAAQLDEGVWVCRGQAAISRLWTPDFRQAATVLR